MLPKKHVDQTQRIWLYNSACANKKRPRDPAAFGDFCI